MFTDTKYTVGGSSGASVRDAAEYLFKEMESYLQNGKEHDIEGLGLSRVHGDLFKSLGIQTHDEQGKPLPVSKEMFIGIMLGDHPVTGKPLKKWGKEHHPGSEIIIAPDGDFSILYSRSNLDEKKLLRELYLEAVRETTEVLQSEVCKIRITERDPITGKKVRKDVTPNGGVCFMEFNHFESRMVQDYVDNGTQTRPDCNIHSHISAPNVALHNGNIYSLENSYLKDAQVKGDMILKNKLYNKLAEKIGIRVVREEVELKSYQSRSRASFRFKIVGITDEMRSVHGHRARALEDRIEQYRQKKIAEGVAKYEAQGKPVPASVYNQKITPEEEKQLSREMRASKADFSQKEMVEAWEQEWDAKGFTHDDLTKIIDQGKALALEDRFEKSMSADALMDLLTSKRQSFTQKDFRDLYLQHNAATGKPYEKLKEEITVALQDFGVELNNEQSHENHRGRKLEGDDYKRVFTSKKLHEAEKNALAWVVENQHRHSKVSITEELAIKGIREWEELKSQELGQTIRLNAEQVQAAIAMCTGKGVVTLIAGHAGTGKTFSIQAANHCLQQFTQAGTAVSGRAAENLSVEGLNSAQATSVAAFLQRYKAEGLKGNQIAIPQILWLDEAATTNSTQLAEILKIGASTKSDFRVICSYDFKQTQAIGATGLLNDIEKACGCIALKEVKRQKTDEALKVAQLARDGDLGGLKQHMKDQDRFDGKKGWYSVAADRNSQIEELADLYMQQAAPAKEKLVVGLLRRDIEDLNAKIREARVAKGEIGQGLTIPCSYKDDESTLTGETRRIEKMRDFSPGDRIIIKEGFKLKTGSGKDMVTEHLLTGYAGEIIDQKSDGFATVRFDNGKVASWNFGKDGQNTVDHFYAGTVNSTQGASVTWCAAMDAGFRDKTFVQAGAANELKKNPETVLASPQKEIDEYAENRNQLYTMLSRHKMEANFITTEALDATFETRYGAYGLEVSTINKVKTPLAIEVKAPWALIDLESIEQQKQKPIEVQPLTLTTLEKTHGNRPPTLYPGHYYNEQSAEKPPAAILARWAGDRVFDLSSRDNFFDVRGDDDLLRENLSENLDVREATRDHRMLSPARSLGEDRSRPEIIEELSIEESVPKQILLLIQEAPTEIKPKPKERGYGMSR